VATGKLFYGFIQAQALRSAVPVSPIAFLESILYTPFFVSEYPSHYRLFRTGHTIHTVAMRFGRTLATSVHSPWRDNYIDYSRLKKLLREDEASPQREWTEQDEEDFVQELINVQLDKVHQFHVDTYKSLRDRTSECEAKLEPIAAAPDGHDAQPEQRSAVVEVMKELDRISQDVERLRKFSRINFTGFLKAAKKHDRKRGLRYRVQPILQVRLSQAPFHSEDYSPLLQRLSAMYTFSHHVLQTDQSDRRESGAAPRPREVYTAHKFWVHADNLLEVKTFILRRLPILIYNPQSFKVVDSSQKDPSITSIYFDNSSFKLYAQKVDKAPEASSLRLRWTGQLKEKPTIHLEKKIVGESVESKEIRIPIKEKYISRFLKGDYKMEKDVGKLEDRHGPDSEQVKTLKKNVKEIQSFLRDNKLEPMLRASYTRTAFQIPGDDRIRVSLDTDLALIREDTLDTQRPCRDPEDWHRTDIDANELEYPYPTIKKGEVSRFPHALLEIKIKDSKATRNNAWLSDLMSSHLVKEVPHFSKFVHGVAQLFEDYVNSFPFWLSDLDTDIRRDPEIAFQEEQQKQAQKAEDEVAVGSFLPGSKLSSSPGFRTKVGSPQKFSPDTRPSPLAQLSQSHRSRRSQLQPTAEEHDSDDDDGVRARPSQIEVSDSSTGGLRAFFPAFSNSRYARRHRQGTAWEDAALPPGVKDPGKWIKDSGPVKVEAKVWLANQRTFVKWQHIAVLLASLSLGLYNAAGVDNNVARALALVYTAFAAFAGIWGWGTYVWRSRLITERSGKDFDNMIGPIVVSIGLAIALCLNFGFKYSARVSAS
jgi:SPX domain protein involved in polyphosphate accumulation